MHICHDFKPATGLVFGNFSGFLSVLTRTSIYYFGSCVSLSNFFIAFREVVD